MFGVEICALECCSLVLTPPVVGTNVETRRDHARDAAAWSANENVVGEVAGKTLDANRDIARLCMHRKWVSSSRRSQERPDTLNSLGVVCCSTFAAVTSSLPYPIPTSESATQILKPDASHVTVTHWSARPVRDRTKVSLPTTHKDTQVSRCEVIKRTI